ncbi:unnamed protein product [Cuscuta europaea]|uniref:CHCH domain-containing protein n=1 Tax=Cuscuta europaea TaxID=41803 RepID=A0A9P0YYB0_CUSEU|nr:unnamed protein product [Cuscuta europaea]
MARRSSGRSTRPIPSRRAPAPAPVKSAPPAAPMQSSGGGSMLGNIGSTIAQGMAFGTGSAVAHRAVDAVMGPRTVQHEMAVAPTPETQVSSVSNSFGGSEACNTHSKAFQDCLNASGNDISKCQFYMDMLSECRRNAMLNA